ncbi:sensor histidine kinase response [Phlyctema vagabunda]|uniref:histidine kinase n=1 Tax=Phlyctema vagabunda TaxID=108571 RepID=A0ABR4P3G1_9HELO
MQESYPSYPNVFVEGKVRTYRPQRARARSRLGDKLKQQQQQRLWAGAGKMEAASAAEAPDPEFIELINRRSLCLPNYRNNTIAHRGDEGFQDALRQYFPTPESNATERLVDLKARLRTASTHDFWAILMEEMCSITGAQCSFVAKRMLVDDQDIAVEMPPLGEPGSCLMGVAFYINNGRDVDQLYRDYRYHAYGTPCAHMRHDKVFIVPERIAEVCPNNPNAANLPFQSEAFIGVPLFLEGKSFGHFCLIWSSEGAPKRRLGWSLIEMFMHSLEDMIMQRIEEGRGFAKRMPSPESTPARIIPLSAITASQSLKPYARSLSHELRTPMQGVIGMLDIMYSTVLDAITNQDNPSIRAVFTELKGHIEVVQDSSKRAVEAADNVVHAYDLNMQMPETPLSTDDEADSKTDYSTSDEQIPKRPSKKRKFSVKVDNQSAMEVDFHPGPPLKKMFTVTEAELSPSLGNPPPTPTSASSLNPVKNGIHSNTLECYFTAAPSPCRHSPSMVPTSVSPTHRRLITRDFLRGLLHDTLRGEHPLKQIHNETPLGETIEVQTQGPRGELRSRLIRLDIELDVPTAIITEERHLYFSIQKIVDNALKFTENGKITITAKMGKNQIVEIWVVDTGCGITEESRLYLFTPHFQEDASISRSRDGLGLSLFNAKAHVRRSLGGDVTLERSATHGENKGSAFLIRLPISTGSGQTPLVGTPTIACQEQDSQRGQHRFTPAPAPAVDGLHLPSTFGVLHAIDATFQQSPTKHPRKKTLCNPHLAKDYPLRFLIAEDNAINRNVAVGALGKLGYSTKDITLAFDGVEAVRAYEESLSKPISERYTAILMDIWMPNMDGYEATKAIKKIAEGHGETTTIFAVTADITSDCMEKAKKIGMQKFLTKPYKVLDLERLIKGQFSKTVA